MYKLVVRETNFQFCFFLEEKTQKCGEFFSSANLSLAFIISLLFSTNYDTDKRLFTVLFLC